VADHMIFVLHAVADKARGEHLAAALASLGAHATGIGPRGDRNVQFGAGSLCVIVWSGAVTRDVAGAMLEATSNAWSNTVICRFGDGDAPMTFGGAPVVDMRPEGAIETLRGLLSDIVAQREASRQAPRGPKLNEATLAKSNAPSFALRSTYGLAATLAVVGVVAPSIIERAQATSPADQGAVPDLPMLTPEATTTLEIAPNAVEMATLEPSHVQRLGRLISASFEPVAESPAMEATGFDRAEALHGSVEDYAIASAGLLSVDFETQAPPSLAPLPGKDNGAFAGSGGGLQVLSGLDARDTALLLTLTLDDPL